MGEPKSDLEAETGRDLLTTTGSIHASPADAVGEDVVQQTLLDAEWSA